MWFYCSYIYSYMWASPGHSSGKEPACQYRGHKRCWFDPWVGKITWRRAWQPTPVFLPGEFHAQRSLAVLELQRVWHDWSDLACMHTYMYIYVIAHGFLSHVYKSFLLCFNELIMFSFFFFFFTSSSLIHLEFILVYDVRYWSNFIFFQVTTQLSQYYLL